MIVIFSNVHDSNSYLLGLLLFERQIEYKWVFPEHVQSVYSDYTGYASIMIEDKCVIDNINNIFINRIPELPTDHPLVIFLQLIPYNNVLTHPNVASILLSKLKQLKLFNLYPKTTVLKNLKITRFTDTCIKSISQIRSFVRESNDKKLIYEGLKYMPVQFQEILYGVHVKSHVIDKDIFSYLFHADTLDPRESSYKLSKYNTTHAMRETLLEIAAKIGVNYFDCDMIIVKDKIFLLEINSSPAPMVFADETKDLGMVGRFIKFLIKREYKVILKNF